MGATSSGNRRWFRFGLRTLLIFLTVLCVWLGCKVNAARRQHEAVQAILQAGGTVYYDYQAVPVAGGPIAFNIDRSAALPVPTWLRSIFGDDFFCNVVDVNFSGTGADFELKRLADLPSIQRVVIRSVPSQSSRSDSQMHLQDSDLAVLAQLSRLQELRLHAQLIQGWGLRSLVGLNHLVKLDLDGTFINDSGTQAIGNLTTLQGLVLTADDVSDAGLHYLSTIPKLKLDLKGPSVAQISDARLEALCQLNNLDVLSFHKSHFANEKSLTRLQNLKNLSGLCFFDCDVTDAGLKTLQGLTNLQILLFQKSQATAQGIRELQQALPKATVKGP